MLLNDEDFVKYAKREGERRRRMTLRERYDLYLKHADDGNGGDITNNGQPLKTFDEWLNS